MLVSPRLAKMLASSALLVILNGSLAAAAFAPTYINNICLPTSTETAIGMSYDPNEYPPLPPDAPDNEDVNYNGDWLMNPEAPPRYVAPDWNANSVNEILTEEPKQKEQLVAPFGVGRDSTKRELNTLWDEPKQKERNVASFGVGADSTKRELRTLWEEPKQKERNVAPFRVGSDSTKRRVLEGPDRRTSGILWHSIAEDTTKRNSAGPNNNNGSQQNFAVGNDSTKRYTSGAGPDRRDADSTQIKPRRANRAVGSQMGDAPIPPRSLQRDYNTPPPPPPSPYELPQEGTSTQPGMAVGGAQNQRPTPTAQPPPPLPGSWQQAAAGNAQAAQVKYYNYNYQAPTFPSDLPQEGTSTPAGTAVGGSSSENSRRNRPRVNHTGPKGLATSSPSVTSSPMDSVPAAPREQEPPVVRQQPPPEMMAPPTPLQQQGFEEEMMDMDDYDGADDMFDMNQLTPEELRAVTQQLIQENMGLKQELTQQQYIYQRLEQRMARLEEGLGGGGDGGQQQW